MEGIFTATIGVCPDGYEWIEADSGDPGASLEPKGDALFNAKSYSPFDDHPVAFYEFAKTPPTPEGILEFANTYGLLWAWADGYRPGEHTLDACRRAILCMKWAVDTWSALRSADEDALSRLTVWPKVKPGDALPVGPSWVSPFAGAEKYLQTLRNSLRSPQPLDFTAYSPDDPTGPAEGLLQSLIDMHVNSASVWLTVGRDADGVPAVIAQVSRLIDALWMLLGQAVVGEIEIRECAHCGKPFALGRSTRSDKRFCSKQCTVLDTYYRKKKARDMRAHGKSLHEIAREVAAPSTGHKATMKKVKEWIGEA